MIAFWCARNNPLGSWGYVIASSISPRDKSLRNPSHDGQPYEKQIRRLLWKCHFRQEETKRPPCLTVRCSSKGTPKRVKWPDQHLLNLHVNSEPQENWGTLSKPARLNQAGSAQLSVQLIIAMKPTPSNRLVCPDCVCWCHNPQRHGEKLL